MCYSSSSLSRFCQLETIVYQENIKKNHILEMNGNHLLAFFENISSMQRLKSICKLKLIHLNALENIMDIILDAIL